MPMHNDPRENSIKPKLLSAIQPEDKLWRNFYHSKMYNWPPSDNGFVNIQETSKSSGIFIARTTYIKGKVQNNN